MEKTFRKEIHVGYGIGKHIEIHGNINDPESWFITIRPLSLFGDKLCPKSWSEQQISEYVKTRLEREIQKINGLLNDIKNLE